jgi:hypothetical protein
MNPGWRSNYLRYKSYFLNVVGRYKERADILAYMEILLSLATISLFSIFALRPTLLTIAGLTREIDSKQEVLDVMTNKIGKLSQAQSLYDRQRAKIVLLKSAIPTESQLDVFVRQILGVSSRRQVQVLGISTGGVTLFPPKTNQVAISNVPEVTTSGQVDRDDVSFSMQSRVVPEEFSSLSEFLTELGKLRRPLDLNNVSLSITGGKISDKEQKYLILGLNGTLPYLSQ